MLKINAYSDVSHFFETDLGAAVKAVILLIVAFIVAAIVKSIIVKLLSKTKLAQAKSPEGEGNQGAKAIELIAKLAQLIVFLLFVPGIFETLGMTQVSAPLLNMLNNVWVYVPNIIGSVIVLWVGFYIAKLVRELLIPVLNKLEINKLQNLAGIQVDDQGKLSNTIAYIVYVLILIPIIIAALYVLNIRAITDPAIAMLSIIFNYIPNIFAALVIIVIGWILSKFIGNIVTRLIEASGLDAKVENLMGSKNKNFILSKVTGKTVEVILVIFFVVESFSALHLGILTSIGLAVIDYMPYALSAFLILIACVFIAGICSKALRNNEHPSLAILVQYLIYTIGAFMILNELGIAKELVDSAFVIAILALGIAFAISFGVGGRDFAKNVLSHFQKKLDIEEAPKKIDEDK